MDATAINDAQLIYEKLPGLGANTYLLLYEVTQQL